MDIIRHHKLADMDGLEVNQAMARTPRPRKIGGSGPPRGGVPDEIKHEIITRLACYDRPIDITSDLNERGIAITDTAVRWYNAENNQKLLRKWRDLYFQTREDFLKEIAAEPVASRAFRVRRLGMLHEQALVAGQREEAARYLEQAAKEVGGIYTNIQKVQGAVLHAHQHRIEDMTGDERRNLLADRLGEALASARKQVQLPPPKDKH